MIAIDTEGTFYPCNRFLPFTMKGTHVRSICNCDTGIDFNRLRPFFALDRISQSTEECVSCDMASGCALCVGLNYDQSKTGTIYERATSICKMHKARCRANDYYWNRLFAAGKKTADRASQRG
jgi:uncharacterized protein